MKTDDWIDLLARGAGPAPRAVAARRLLPVAVAGALLAAVLAVSMWGPLAPAQYATSATWLKLAYAAGLAGAAGWLAARLARPVPRWTGPAGLVLAVTGTMALAGLATLAAAPEGERMTVLMGSTWADCPWNVLKLSLPALAGGLWAVRGLAPTRPRAAGFAVGLFAGALGACGYALHCPESSAAFVAVWYSLGILLAGSLGALLGPRLLRW